MLSFEVTLPDLKEDNYRAENASSNRAPPWTHSKPGYKGCNSKKTPWLVLQPSRHQRNTAQTIKLPRPQSRKTVKSFPIELVEGLEGKFSSLWFQTVFSSSGCYYPSRHAASPCALLEGTKWLKGGGFG